MRKRMSAFRLVSRYMISILWLITKVLPSVLSDLDSGVCTRKCGNVTIPYPFGIQPGCYLNSSYAITCVSDSSSGTQKAFLKSLNNSMEVTHISLWGNIRVRNPVISSNCSTNYTSPLGVDLSSSPFYFSDTYNRFTALGCSNIAIFTDKYKSTLSGCLSICSEGPNIKGCNGINCCQTTIPPDLKSFDANMTTIDTNIRSERGDCRQAFMVEQEWFEEEASIDMKIGNGQENVPAVLEYGQDQGYCSIVNIFRTYCGYDRQGYTYHWGKVDSNHLCVCSDLYTGGSSNSISVSRSSISSTYRDLSTNCFGTPSIGCRLVCLYSPQSKNCSCPYGYDAQSSFDQQPHCSPADTVFPPSPFRSSPFPPSLFPPSPGNNKRVVTIGSASGSGLPIILIITWFLCKYIIKKKEEKQKQKFFKRNGGLLLQQELSSNQNSIDKTKLFTSKELEKATDHYNVTRILGQGGQGTVYKGMLTDGRIVAVKKSKIVREAELGHFINEVVILSQINHRNVVKLLGCCLETDVPLLVYEFIPNGTLFDYIHYQNEEFPLTWVIRLRIATEVSNALSYLHSAASTPIYHRDIKSTNILLDEKYRAKVSDFGTSRSIAIDQTHLTTNVAGTFGYLDPEYFQSSQFTDKSDVYSFGVVLVELLTSQKAVSSMRSVENRSLATFFLVSMEENRLFEIVDPQVIKDGGKDEITIVAKLAKRCLSLNGRSRPTMKDVAKEREGIKMIKRDVSIKQNQELVNYAFDDIVQAWDGSSCSNMSSLNTGR